jgi:hypothetical protein
MASRRMSLRDNPSSFAERLTADETPVFSREVLESERRAYMAEYGQYEGDALFRQEYYCDFSAANIGAILGRYVEAADKEGRLTEVESDPNFPIEVSCDIGFRDTASFWFWQARPDGYALVDYDEDTGLDASDWIDRLKAKPYTYGSIWLPHDAIAKTFQTKRSVTEQFQAARIAQRVDMVPMLSKADRINAARIVIERCRFDKVKCKTGLDGLRSWAYEYNDETKTYSKEPRHDWASHPGDGFSYGAVVMRQRQLPKVVKPINMRGPQTIGEMVAASDRSQHKRERV